MNAEPGTHPGATAEFRSEKGQESELLARFGRLTDLIVMARPKSEQALDLIGKVFINPGDHILVERPTYLGALQAWNAYQAEYVAADIDDQASVEKALAGAHGAFCVTFFWAHFSPEKEMAQAKAMAEAGARPDQIVQAVRAWGYRDALAACDWLKTNKNTPAGQIIAYGESLGCAMAVEVAVQRSVAGVVLESSARIVRIPSMVGIGNGRYLLAELV